MDRVRRATKGKADVLVVSTVPAASRWGTVAELAEACRAAAKDRKAGLADADKAFLEAGKEDLARHYSLPATVFTSDSRGHEVMARAVLEAIDTRGAVATLR